ncbi:MAG: hypothetical protein KC503_31625 [Myxococcales bacterium]|nr:hypothetical protein [Myxococcales bacterium]
MSLRWPVLGIVENRYRKLRPHAPADDEPEGPTVLCGELSRHGGLLWLDERICLSEDASLMLLDDGALDDEALDGRLVVVAGVLRRTARPEGPFDSYREAPTLEMLDSACVMDLAGWAYYSASTLGRVGYLSLGRLMSLSQAIRAGLPDGRRTVAAIAIALIATTLVVVTSSFIITSNRTMRRSLEGLGTRAHTPAVLTARELSRGECSASAAREGSLVAESAVDLAIKPTLPQLLPSIECGGSGVAGIRAGQRTHKGLQTAPGSVVHSEAPSGRGAKPSIGGVSAPLPPTSH